jgi:hypothetical protein
MNSATDLAHRLAIVAYPWVPSREAHELANNIAQACELDLPYVVASRGTSLEVEARRLCARMIVRRQRNFGLHLIADTEYYPDSRAARLSEALATTITIHYSEGFPQ